MASSNDRVKEGIKRFLDAGASVSKMSRREIEEAARSLVRNATPTKERLEDALEELRAQSRRGAEHVQEMVQTELRRELDAAAKRRRAELADLFERVAGVFGDFISRDHPGAKKGASSAAENTSAAVVAEEASAEKAAPKKAAPKKAAAKKAAGAKKAAPKKAPAKKAAAGAKKAAPKKAPAKKTAPQQTSAQGDSASS